MQTYSDDLRERVVRACDEKRGTRKEIAELFSVSTAWIRRLLQRRRASGDFSARRRGGCKPAKFRGEKLDQLRAWVDEQPDATLQELLDRSGVDASIMAVHRALERLGCHRKKVPARQRTRTPRCDGAACGVARTHRPRGSTSSGLPRRERGQDQHDPSVWTDHRRGAGSR